MCRTCLDKTEGLTSICGELEGNGQKMLFTELLTLITSLKVCISLKKIQFFNLFILFLNSFHLKKLIYQITFALHALQKYNKYLIFVTNV